MGARPLFPQMFCPPLQHSTERSGHTHWQMPKESMLCWVPCEKWVKIEAPPNQFPGWKEVLHPSQPVITAGQTPLAAGDTKQKPYHWSSEARRAWHQRAEE